MVLRIPGLTSLGAGLALAVLTHTARAQSVSPRQQPSQEEWAARFKKAERAIRRLPVESFPALPATVAKVLRVRNCQIPQPFGYAAPVNVVRGQFFVKGESGWAVLCSVNGSSALLVFRSDQDSTPQELHRAKDLAYLQGLGGDTIGYSRQITVVGRDFIVRHYRAYGGPKPPPIDHQGIDDAFLEKASGTWYFYRGRWLRLQGSD